MLWWFWNHQKQIFCPNTISVNSMQIKWYTAGKEVKKWNKRKKLCNLNWDRQYNLCKENMESSYRRQWHLHRRALATWQRPGLGYEPPNSTPLTCVHYQSSVIFLSFESNKHSEEGRQIHATNKTAAVTNTADPSQDYNWISHIHHSCYHYFFLLACIVIVSDGSVWLKGKCTADTYKIVVDCTHSSIKSDLLLSCVKNVLTTNFIWS